MKLTREREEFNSISAYARSRPTGRENEIESELTWQPVRANAILEVLPLELVS